jgi:hydroxymethylpyrimidine/phosphomethylpyrimidine kinase
MRPMPVALTIAGSDSSAGAGIQADLKTFCALGVYGLTVVTCVVAEIPGKVFRVEPLSPAIVREQINVLLKNFPVGAIKTGLLCSAEIISTVAKALRSAALPGIPLVIDPVIVATSGDPLLEPAAIQAYERELFPLAALITPNLAEARRLLGARFNAAKSMRRAGEELARKWNTAVLLKGGHLAGERATDLLFANGKIVEFPAPFVRKIATHGTGCTLSAAIVAGLASGLSLEKAVRRAKKYVTGAIAGHARFPSRAGGALHALRHF